MGGVVVRTDNVSAVTKSDGLYTFYYNAKGPFSLFVDDKSVAIDKRGTYKKYVFGNPWEIGEDKSYDFVIDRPINVYGFVRGTNGKTINKPIKVTAVIGMKEYDIILKSLMENQHSLSMSPKMRGRSPHMSKLKMDME